MRYSQDIPLTRTALTALFLTLVVLAAAIAAGSRPREAAAGSSQSDLKIVGQTVTAADPDGPPLIGDDGFDNDGDTLTDEDGAGDCDGDADPDDDGDTAVDEDGGDCPIIYVAKQIHNNGPDGPAPYVISKSISAIGSNGGPLSCTFTERASNPLTGSLAVSVSDTHYESWVVDCPPLGFGVDDDGDSPDQPCGPTQYQSSRCVNYIDEDPIDGVDNDGDTLLDEDGPVGVVVVVVENEIATDDPGFTDPDLSDNTDTDSSLVLTSELPFGPTFTANQDEVDSDVPTHPSPSTDCFVSLPCKMALDYAIAGGGPLSLQTVLGIPASAYTITRPTEFSRVGRIGTFETIDPGVGTCETPFPGILDLVNAALPEPGGASEAFLVTNTGGAYTPKAALAGQLPDDSTDGVDNDGDTLVDEDPASGAHPPFPAGDDDGDTRIDEDDVTALRQWTSWSSHLDAAVLAVSTSFPTSDLMMRQIGVSSIPEAPILNVLVFFDPNASGPGQGGYLAVAIVDLYDDRDDDNDALLDGLDADDDGDGLPDYADLDDDNDGLSDHLEIFKCTPTSASLIQFGLSADNFSTVPVEGGETVITCNDVDTAPGHTLFASFLRADTLASPTVLDQQTCSVQPEPTPTPGPPGVGGIVRARAGSAQQPAESRSLVGGGNPLAAFAAMAGGLVLVAAGGWYVLRRGAR